MIISIDIADAVVVVFLFVSVFRAETSFWFYYAYFVVKLSIFNYFFILIFFLINIIITHAFNVLRENMHPYEHIESEINKL